MEESRIVVTEGYRDDILVFVKTSKEERKTILLYKRLFKKVLRYVET